MMSVRKAITFLIAEALALILSVVTARAFAETPWLMLPFYLRLDFTFNLRGNHSEARLCSSPHRGSLPGYLLWRRVCAVGNR